MKGALFIASVLWFPALMTSPIWGLWVASKF